MDLSIKIQVVERIAGVAVKPFEFRVSGCELKIWVRPTVLCCPVGNRYVSIGSRAKFEETGFQ